MKAVTLVFRGEDPIPAILSGPDVPWEDQAEAFQEIARRYERPEAGVRRIEVHQLHRPFYAVDFLPDAPLTGEGPVSLAEKEREKAAEDERIAASKAATEAAVAEKKAAAAEKKAEEKAAKKSGGSTDETDETDEAAPPKTVPFRSV